MKGLTTNKKRAKRGAKTNLYVMNRKRRQKEQVNWSLDQTVVAIMYNTWCSRHYVLRRETEPLLILSGTALLCVCYTTSLNISYFLLLFFSISVREICSLFLLQCSHYELNFNLFYTEQVLSYLWRTLLQLNCAVYLHLILSLTSDTYQSRLQVKSFCTGSNHNNQSRSKPAYNEIRCLGLDIELTCV